MTQTILFLEYAETTVNRCARVDIYQAVWLQKVWLGILSGSYQAEGSAALKEKK